MIVPPAIDDFFGSGSTYKYNLCILEQCNIQLLTINTLLLVTVIMKFTHQKNSMHISVMIKLNFHDRINSAICLWSYMTH